MGYTIKLTPRSEREITVSNRVAASDETDFLYDFRGEKTALKVVVLPIDLPVYRMDNCRTYSEQQDAIAREGLGADFFSKGQESTKAQTYQHQLLVKLAKHSSETISSIIEVLKKEGQRGPILITSTGVVVNGNRRLSAMRELHFADNSDVTSKWAWIQCMVLPVDTTADEIDDIEANEQGRPHTKLDYNWIGDAHIMRRQINKGRTTKQVADQLRRGEPEIRNLIQAISEADLYLSEWAKKPGQYSLVSGDAEQIFGDLPKRLAGKSVPLTEASRVIAWTLFENKDKLPGRVYAFNAAFGKLAENVLNRVAEQMDLPAKDTSSPIDEKEEDFLVAIDGGMPSNEYTDVIATFRDPETKADAVEALISAAQSEIEREHGQKSRSYALKAMGQIHAKLAAIDVTTAGAETYPGLNKQLQSIEDLVRKLSERLEKLSQSTSTISPPEEKAS